MTDLNPFTPHLVLAFLALSALSSVVVVVLTLLVIRLHRRVEALRTDHDRHVAGSKMKPLSEVRAIVGLPPMRDRRERAS